MIISAMGENVSSATPSESELLDWASTFGLTTPVVADPGWALLARFSTARSYPRYTLIGPGAEVIFVDQTSYDTSDIEAVLPY